jgi:tRNA(Arg) A34 adenosine deaminase TadA
MYEKFMADAIAQAEQAKHNGNYPFGAVIVRDSEIIATGQCLEVTEQDVTRHAELIAVSSACRALGRMSLEDCILVASGEPCNMCASAAFQADIGTVVVGATRDDLAHFFRIREIGLRQLAEDSSHKVDIITGVLREEAIRLFDGVKK